MLRKAIASALLLIAILQLTACGGGGGTSNPPPDPASIATPLSPTGITPFDQATAFLYQGEKPIQTGVLDGVIEARRAAVLRGKVLDRNNQPLAGVTITVLDHPELGQTLTREDGMFDLAVNGGGLLTINYKKDGLLPSQRQVQTPWQDYAWLPEVVLIPIDQAVATIDLTRATTLQVARGSVVTDDDGKRQATVLFPQGVQAEMELPDGSRQALTTLHVRATEYTVGANGPKAMPGALPPTSGYTYAAELSVDEAMAVGAKTVRFDKPVPVYVENFLDFPVGGIVPAGWYDRDKAAWIPSDNGRVIEVIAVDNGLAQLDIDGSGNAADAAALAALGVDDAERRQLAGMYVAGTSLWRTPVTHFTPWDYNWPYGPKEDSEPPKVPRPKKADKKPKDPDCKDGSIIECQSQTLGERVAIAGTAFTLNYRSDRVPGRKAANVMDIVLTEETLPPELKRVILVIDVAGQHFEKEFSPQPNQRYRFEWDGKDSYGRTPDGSQKATIRIGYVYDGQYHQPAEFSQSFAAFSGIPISGDSTRQEITLWQLHDELLTTTRNNNVAGGWSIDAHHAYNHNEQAVYLGSGEKQLSSAIGRKIVIADGLSQYGYGGDGGLAIGADGSVYIASRYDIRKIDAKGIITTFAGDVTGCGSSTANCGDGGPALAAGLNGAKGMAFDKQGNLYVAEYFRHRIRKIDSQGIITTVAGTGVRCTSMTSCGNDELGDGGLAVNARLNAPIDVAVAPDGSLYIADMANHRIRKVDPSGVISTVAGNGTQGFNGDNGPAVQASLRYPTNIAVGPDGSLYIADTSNHRIRRVGPDGVITTLAGNGVAVSSGDGGLAIEAQIKTPADVVVKTDGTVIFSDYGGRKVRAIGTNGIITTVAGSGTPAEGSVDANGVGIGGLAINAKLSYPWTIAIAPDDSYYLTELTFFAYKIPRSNLEITSQNGVFVPSSDGTELFAFDASGRHLQTLDARTRQVIHQFGYDTTGYLTSITDTDNNVTRIERNGATPLAIIAPDGQRTELSVDQNGYLSAIRNPAGETHKASYTPDGLLLSFTDPRGATSRMTYDELGLLVADENAAGGGWKLVRAELDNGYEVSMTSALGRKTTYRIENLPIGDQRRTTFHPDGTRSLKLIGADGTETSTDPDGTVQKVSYGPDPRFGMQAPLAAQVTLTLPSGLINKSTTTRTATLADKHDLLSLTAEVTTTTVNGRAYQSSFDVANRTLTRLTPTQRQAVTTLDEKGRTIAAQLTGLAPLSYAYDGRGRLSAITQGSGSEARSTRFQYGAGGYLASVTDAAGRTTRYQHDGAGRVTHQTLPDGRAIGYQYDANGNLTALTPPGREAHVFNYSTLNQQAGYTPPKLDGAATVTQYNYNLDKQLTRIDRPDGKAVNLAYDAGGRVTQITHPDGQIGYGYHPATGQLSEIATRDQSLSYAYDGFLPKSETWSGTVSGSVTRSVDANFWTTQIAVNGQAVNYQYDNDGLLTQAGDLGLTRNSANGLLTATSVGSIRTAYGYNGFGELASQSASSATSNNLYSASYTRDALGRITSKTETVNGSTDTFGYSYDGAGRLIGVTRNGQLIAQYQYDTNGNRIGGFNPQGSLASSVDSQDRLIRQDTTTFSYNANGDLTAKSERGVTSFFHYDALGNLRQARVPGDITIDYVIDGKNRRVGKKINGVLKQGFLFQDDLNPIAELDGQGNVVARFVYATKPNVPDYMIKGGKTYRLITDHLGSPRLIVDTASGDIAQRIDYDEFGNVLSDTNPGFQPFGFAGGLYDQHTQLVRFGARDYDPQTGRWTAKDPIRFEGGDGNLYGYVLGDPVNLVDPTGHVGVVGAVVGGVIGGISGAIGTAATGGDLGDIVTAAGVGAVAGAVIGAYPMGLMGEVIRGGLTGGISSYVSERYAMHSDPCRKFNVGAVIGSAIGGAIGAGRANIGGGAAGSSILGQSVNGLVTAGVPSLAVGAIGTGLGQFK